jgi:hypothetical protein
MHGKQAQPIASQATSRQHIHYLLSDSIKQTIAPQPGTPPGSDKWPPIQEQTATTGAHSGDQKNRVTEHNKHGSKTAASQQIQRPMSKHCRRKTKCQAEIKPSQAKKALQEKTCQTKQP